MKVIAAIQVVVSILLIISILLQNRGSGLGGAFGGDFGGYYTKRGMKKFLFYAYVSLGVLFMVLAVISMMLA